MKNGTRKGKWSERIGEVLKNPNTDFQATFDSFRKKVESTLERRFLGLTIQLVTTPKCARQRERVEQDDTGTYALSGLFRPAVFR